MATNNTMYVIKRDGTKEEVDFGKVQKRLEKLANDIAPKLRVNSTNIGQQIIIQISDGIKTSELDELAASICANKESIHPDYGRLATRIIISNHHKNTSPSFSEVVQTLWSHVDKTTGRPLPLVAPYFYELVMRNKEKINTSLDYNKDYNYSYFGFKTLERAYLMRVNGEIIERPQHMLMRVSLAIHRDDIREAIKCYKLMAEGSFTHATPTLFNMGSPREQASSCFLLDIAADSIDGMYKTIGDCAKISKHAGGIGVAIHKIRAKDSFIYGTNGRSNGIVPMLRVFNEVARHVNQGGRRNGSIAIYLEPWHGDIVEFLALKKNTGIEAERCRDLFFGLWIPDLFMKRVEADEDWTLMCPSICPGLHDCYGKGFEELYCKYEAEGRGLRVMKARDLYQLIVEARIEGGIPYMLYKDAINHKNNQANLGVIQSSNLCAEIVEFTSPNEIAVCNLASISLPKMVEYTVVVDPATGIESRNASFDFRKLEEVVKMATKNLNKIIDYNYYPALEAERSNRRHRPIGIGVQGLADVFAMMRMPFESREAADLNRLIFAHMYLSSLETSMDIARKRKKHLQEFRKLRVSAEKGENLSNDEMDRLKTLKSEQFIIDEEYGLPMSLAGAYSSFVGSPASNGQLQYDMWGVQPPEELIPRFEKLKEDIKKHGLRNSLCLAVMPTASTSQIMGNNECCEPYTSNIYKRRTLAGEFKIVNPYLMSDLIDLGIWNQELKDKIIMAGGSVQAITEIPASVRALYKTVWEISQKVLIDMAADRGAFICQTQSMNLFMTQPTKAKITSMDFYAWKRGLKTGIYYLRTQAIASAQKFSVDVAPVSSAPTNVEEGKECIMCSA